MHAGSANVLSRNCVAYYFKRLGSATKKASLVGDRARNLLRQNKNKISTCRIRCMQAPTFKLFVGLIY